MSTAKFEFCKKASQKRRAVYFQNHFEANKGLYEKFEQETGINPSRLKSEVHGMSHTNVEKAFAYFKLSLSDYYKPFKN